MAVKLRKKQNRGKRELPKPRRHEGDIFEITQTTHPIIAVSLATFICESNQQFSPWYLCSFKTLLNQKRFCFALTMSVQSVEMTEHIF